MSIVYSWPRASSWTTTSGWDTAACSWSQSRATVTPTEELPAAGLTTSGHAQPAGSATTASTSACRTVRIPCWRKNCHVRRLSRASSTVSGEDTATVVPMSANAPAARA